MTLAELVDKSHVCVQTLGELIQYSDGLWALSISDLIGNYTYLIL